MYRTKRAGHVTSKMRFQSAQLIAYLSDGLWLRTAANVERHAWPSSRPGSPTLGVEFVNRPDVNMLFAYVDDAAADQLEGGRACCSTAWAAARSGSSRAGRRPHEDVEQALAAFDAALA